MISFSYTPLARLVAVMLVVAPVPALAQAAAPPAVTTRAGPLQADRVARLKNPWGMAYLPDSGLLVTEMPGRLRVWRDGFLSSPIAGVPKVAFRGQGDLLDVEIDPRVEQNGIIYISYAELAERQPGGRDVADSRLGVYQKLDDAKVKSLAVAHARLQGGALTDLKVIWRALKTVGRGHFGGRLAFLPDSTLLITTGGRQRFEPAQDRGSRIGKIIRIRSDGRLPTDTPFANGPQDERDVWTYGHRNQLGVIVAPGSGEVWVNEMGPMGGDEINLITTGGNYGWPVVSAGDNYDATSLARPATRPGLIPAKITWNPSVSPSGMALYTGAAIPAWKGSLLIGGLSSKALIRAVPQADGAHDVEVIPVGFRVRDVIEAPDGALLLLKDGEDGALVRVTPARKTAVNASSPNIGAR